MRFTTGWAHKILPFPVEGQTFRYLREFFPKLSEAKQKHETFIEPQIRKLFKDPMFDTKLINFELAAWFYFKAIICGFYRRDDDCGSIVTDLLNNYERTRVVECH